MSKLVNWVKIELYGIKRPKAVRTDASSLRYTVGPAGGSTGSELVQRIAAAFPLYINASKHPDPITGPLAAYRQPIVGDDTPEEYYLGRIVIELHGTPDLQEQHTDLNNLRYTVDPAGGLTESELAQRIAIAFPLRAKSHPYAIVPY